MKKAIQPLAIILIILVTVTMGAVILRTKPTASASAEEVHGEQKHKHSHGEEDEHEVEGRVEINEARLKNAELVIAEAGSVKIKVTLKLFGKIAANEEHLAHVTPRFAGVVRVIKKRLGDPVAKGETLAVVESNDSLRPYDVRSEIAGTVTAKDATLGELVNEQRSMFTIADLSTVWVDLNVYREDFSRLRVGQKVLVDSGAGGAPPGESEISYLSPFGAENTQSMLARAVVPNPAGALRPGIFIGARVVLDEVEAPVAVRTTALQTIDNKPVVFVQEGDSFEARVVELGERDHEWVAVIAGVRPGEKYAATNSFILKAEIGKESAAHEH